MVRSVLAASLASLFWCSTVGASVPDPTVDEAFWGRFLSLPRVEQVKTFLPGDRQANFTFFEGVENVAVENGALRFTLSGEKATLGWGNYQGRQPVAEVADLWEETNIVRVRVRQSEGQSQWTLLWWADGKAMDARARDRAVSAPAEATLEGGDWQELEFRPNSPQVPTPDGAEIQISGPRGARFEVERVRVVQPRCEGYVRKEFVLPSGQIWRAIADVGGPPDVRWFGVNRIATTLYVNGREVKRKGPRFLYHVSGVDLAPYLKPGKNCIAFRGYRVLHSPFIYLQATVIPVAGEPVTMRTDASWKYSPVAGKGWNEVGYDDSSWKAPGESQDHLTYYEGGRYQSQIRSRSADGSLSMPAYQGRLVIERPGQPDLIYHPGAPVSFEVRVPAGLRSQAPVLEYILGRADAAGLSAPQKRGTLRSFRTRGTSLVYTVAPGQLGRGVYTVELALRGKSGVIEERPREPLMVLRKFAPAPGAGGELREGRDLELEDSIDFTDPNDPHPCVEAVPGSRDQPAVAVTTPRIVRKGDLVYRETADRRGASFSYRFQFRHPGSFYLMELEYPDDAQREIEVSISSKVDAAWSNSQSGVGAETGGKFYLTDKMQRLSWIHVADAGAHSVDVVNIQSGLKAAARSLKVYRIKGELPSAGSGDARLLGIHTERCYFTSGIGMNFGTGQPLSAPQEEAEQQLPFTRRFVKDLVWMQDTAERYCQYLRYTGQNVHIMGCYQYEEYNTPFARHAEVDTARIPDCTKTVLANVLDANGVSFFAGLEWSQFRNLGTFANNAQVARGADTLWMVNGKGEQVYGNVWSTVVTNWLHPVNRERFHGLLGEVQAKFGNLPHFKGIHLLLGDAQYAPYYLPGFAIYPRYEDPFALSYDDVSFAQLQKETGLALGIAADDPQRFEKRRALLADPAFKEQFTAWRCRKVQEFLADTVRTVRTAKPDRQVMCVLPIEDTGFFKYWLASGRPYQDVLRDSALDLALLTKTPDLWVGRWTIGWRQGGASQDPLLWIPKVDPDLVSGYDQGAHRYALVRTSWDENLSPTPGYSGSRDEAPRLVASDWIMSYNRVRALPQPGGYHAREPMLQALIASDPDALIYGFTDLNINVGHEEKIRAFARVLTRLPQEKFETALGTGFATNFAIRQLHRGTDSYLYVANPGYWQISGSLTLETDGKVYDLVGGAQVALQQQDGKSVLPISLEPYGVVAYRVTSPRLAIESYRTGAITDHEKAHMERILESVARLLPAAGASASLTDDDRQFLTESLARAKSALAEGQHARVWSTVTHWRFWSLWQALQKVKS
ncbi:MAG: hypothetical protein HY321_04180 [Armatimonadetes bacterium]|nr:hypothetical protein [Armatimonadota bacterium]